MYKHLLVPTDGSELSQAAVRQAAHLARELSARILLLYVQPGYPSTIGSEVFASGSSKEEFVRQCAASADGILARATAEVERAEVSCKHCTAISDEPWQVIVNMAKFEDCDLIVMASHGRKGIAGLLIGSQTQKVLTHSKIPVLVCR